MDSDQENSSSGPSGSLLESLGAELVSILAPVSACMLFVVLLVRALVVNSSQLQAPAIALVIYAEDPSDSTSEKLGGALLNALVFVAFVTAATFLLVGLFYLRCTKCLRLYVSFSIFNVLVYLGAALGVLFVQTYSLPVDVITFSVVIFNFGVVGVLVAFPVMPVPIIFTQGYLVLIGMLTAFWFTFLPEWTTWFLLVAMALYDIAAVLLPGGPLNMLLELASKREEELPALVYESRPVVRPGQQGSQSRRWRRRVVVAASPSTSAETAPSRTSLFARIFGYRVVSPYQTVSMEAPQRAEILQAPEEEAVETSPGEAGDGAGAPGNRDRDPAEEAIPLMSRHVDHRMETLSAFMANEERAAGAIHDELRELNNDGSEGGELGRIESVTEGGIKLGLGDFIFYSVLVGRAAMFDLMTVWACYLAIVAGLGATLALLAVWRRALPALPISISLGVVFYFLTRLVLEPYVLQLDTRLVFF
ncbi:presenilin-like protein At2g29900 [Selaginella moellendorffii]|uniref:presenilin-like protein At2g29900 n=1 Tax=Selaginella moellendorffii TaxID=88036 RepID=UPI000D1CC2A5|nr:presenilin-like protein At2g29900 [Selaginella moellendorffii]|eukprot:XP_024539181.1 presenilin-like protein At2g29900 [Selaginella moellendorffii]